MLPSLWRVLGTDGSGQETGHGTLPLPESQPQRTDSSPGRECGKQAAMARAQQNDSACAVHPALNDDAREEIASPSGRSHIMVSESSRRHDGTRLPPKSDPVKGICRAGIMGRGDSLKAALPTPAARRAGM